jgi:site-specific DNA-adenine methylase
VTPVNDRRSRWNPRFYSQKARRVSELFRSRSVILTATDYAPLITAPGDATIFLDPPYYLGGPKLYRHRMEASDHMRLARLLRMCPHRWLLTYDDHPFIRRLYRWATVELVRVRYSGRPDRRPYRMETELVITPGRLRSDE